MTLIERLDLSTLKVPTSTSRDLLAYFHSGDVLRQVTPWLMRLASVTWLVFYVLIWIVSWPGVYREFERWGLVKAFVAQLIALATAFLVTRITILRAQQLAVLPADDFVTLRAMALLLRWLAETALVFALGTGLSTLLQPAGAGSSAFVSSLSPSLGAQLSTGATGLLLASAPMSLALVTLVTGLFLVLYTLANAIDLGLAIEWNTRAERAGQRAL